MNQFTVIVQFKLPNLILRNFFKEIVNLCYACTVWKNEKFTLIEKIFREITYLVLSLVKTLL